MSKKKAESGEDHARAERVVPERVKVELLKPHTHRGVSYGPGDRIEVRPDQAEWLRKAGVVK